MTILAVGTSPGDFNAIMGNADLYTDTNRLAPDCASGVGVAYSAPFRFKLADEASEVWIAFHLYISTSGTSDSFLKLLHDGTAVAQVDPDGLNAHGLELWTGSAWVEVAGDVALQSTSTLQRWDVHLSLADSGGVFEVFINGLSALAFTGDTIRGSKTVVNEIELAGTVASSNTSWTQFSGILVSTESTLGKRVVPLYPTGAGSLAEQLSGTFADVDETPVNDADFVRLDASGERVTFAMGDLPAGYASGWSVDRVVAAARASAGIGSAVAAVEPMVRSGASNAYGTARACDTTPRPRLAEFAVDPATGSTWTYAGVNGMEIGARAAVSGS